MVISTDLTFQYPDSPLLQFPDMQLGDSSVIVGPSGAGKTTLLHLLGGILTPKTGRIHINDTDIFALKNRALDAFRAKQIGIVFQHHHSIKALTARENLEIIQKMGSGKIQKQNIDRLLSELNLIDVANKLPAKMSQGQKQRLSIALAMINQPTLLLADEPTSSLDDANCEKVIELLKHEAKLHQFQLIVITHDQRVMNHFNEKVEL